MIKKISMMFKNILLKTILGLVILSFILTSIGEYLFYKKQDYIVKVNGHKITKNDLQKAFNEEIYYKQNILGNKDSLFFNENYLHKIKKQVFLKLLNQVLLNQYIKKLNIRVNDEQVIEEIISKPLFQSNGMFDNNKYNIIIENMGFTPLEYAENLRQKIANSQLIKLILKSSFVLDNEIKLILNILKEERIIRQIKFNIDELSEKQKINFNDIKNFYQENKNKFLEPEKFIINYIKLHINYDNKNNNTNNILKKTFKITNLQPISYRFSIIKTKKKSDAELILNKLKHGFSFNKLIKMKSIKLSSIEKMCDIGWFSSYSIPKFLKDIKLTKKGQLSNIIQNSKNFIIVRLEDLQYDKMKIPSKTSNNIFSEKNDWNKFYYLRKQLKTLINEKKLSFNEIANHLKLKVLKTELFDKNNFPKDLNSKKIKKAILNRNFINNFQLKNTKNQNNNIIVDDNDSFYLVKLVKYQFPYIQSFNQAKSKIIKILKYNQAKKQIKTNVINLLKNFKSNKKMPIDSIYIEYIKCKKLHHYMYNQLNNNKILSKKLIQDVFNAPKPILNQPSWGITVNHKGETILFAIDKIIKSSISDIEISKIRNELINQKSTNIINTILFSLQKEANIKYGNFKNI